MRETLIKEGVQDRLSNLIGDGESAYSAQQSMIDDMKRIHYAILGNSPYGKVMGGMTVSVSSTTVIVDSGYGVTVGGNLIKFGKQYDTGTGAVENSTGNIYYAYANYIVAERDDDQGGKTQTIINELTPQNIIKDQVGANGETTSEALVTVEDGASAGISATDTKLYLATIQFDDSGNAIVTRESDNEGVAYTYSKDVDSPIWLPNTDATSYLANIALNKRSSLIMLDPGRSRLKRLSIMRFFESTTGARIDDATFTTGAPTDFYINFSIEGINNAGSAVQTIASSLVLEDMVNIRNFRQDFSIEEVVSDAVVGIQIGTSITNSTATTSLYFEQTYSTPAKISYIIERLT